MSDNVAPEAEIVQAVERHEKKVFWWTFWVSGVAGLVTAVGLALAAILLPGQEPSKVWAMVGVLPAVMACLVVCLRTLPKGWNTRAVALRREAQLAKMARRAGLIQIACVGAALLSARFMGADDAPFRIYLIVLSVIGAIATMLTAVLGPFLANRKRYAAYLDDELTTALRGKAAKAGFVALAPLIAGLYLISLWRPGLAAELTPALLWLAAAIPTLAFNHLSKSAERAGGD